MPKLNPYSHWMSEISGAISLDKLAIPGSHASVTYRLLAGDDHSRLHACQSLNLREQFEIGIRIFDVTVRDQGSSPSIVHRGVDCGVGLGEFLQECSDLVDRYSTEGLIILLTKDDANVSDRISSHSDSHNEFHGLRCDGQSFCQKIETLSQGLVPFIRQQKKLPSIDTLRGKILILRRYQLDYPDIDANASNPLGMDVSDWPDNANGSLTLGQDKLQIQDQYILTDMTALRTKWEAIRDHIEEGTSVSAQRCWYWHYISCEFTHANNTHHSLSPAWIAYEQVLTLLDRRSDGLNGHLYAYLMAAQPNAVYRGVFMLDFVNHHQHSFQTSQHLVLRLLAFNRNYRQDIRTRYLGQSAQALQRSVAISNGISKEFERGHLAASGDYLLYQLPHPRKANWQLQCDDLTRRQGLQTLDIEPLQQLALRADTRFGIILQNGSLQSLDLRTFILSALRGDDSSANEVVKSKSFSINQGGQPLLVSYTDGVLQVFDIAKLTYEVVAPQIALYHVPNLLRPVVNLAFNGSYASLIDHGGPPSVYWVDLVHRQQQRFDLLSLGKTCLAAMPLHCVAMRCVVAMNRSVDHSQSVSSLFVLRFNNLGQWTQECQSHLLNSTVIALREDPRGRYILVVCVHAIVVFNSLNLECLWQLEDVSKKFHDAVFDHHGEKVMVSFEQRNKIHINEFDIKEQLMRTRAALAVTESMVDISQYPDFSS